jgi:hypothetical protein
MCVHKHSWFVDEDVCVCCVHLCWERLTESVRVAVALLNICGSDTLMEGALGRPDP